MRGRGAGVVGITRGREAELRRGERDQRVQPDAVRAGGVVDVAGLTLAGE
jgi:hypothetical protein